jgi:hypothetical protein
VTVSTQGLVADRKYLLSHVQELIGTHKTTARDTGHVELTDFCCRQMLEFYADGDDAVHFWHVEASLASRGE